MDITNWLDRSVTTSRSLTTEYGYWAPLAMAEVRAKLLDVMITAEYDALRYDHKVASSDNDAQERRW